MLILTLISFVEELVSLLRTAHNYKDNKFIE